MGWEIFGPPAPKRPLLPTLAGPPKPESGYGPWEATASPLVQRRRKPDGSYETRATPGAVPGGKPGLGKVELPDTSAKAIAASGLKLFGASVLDNITSAPEQVEAALEAPRTLIRKAVGQSAQNRKLAGMLDTETAAELLRGPEMSVVRDQPYRQTLRDLHQKRTGEFAEATEGLGSLPIAELPFVGAVRLPVAPTLYAGLELGAGLVDPTNLPAAGPLKPAGAAREAVDLLEGISFKALDDADLQTALRKGVEPISPGYGGSAEAFRFAAWLDKHGLDYDAVSRFGELPWLREKFFNLDNPDVTPPPSFYGAKPGESGHITFGRDPDPVEGLEEKARNRLQAAQADALRGGEANYALPEALATVDPAALRGFDAHGMIRGNPATQTRDLMNLLDRGIDPDRPFHTAPLSGEGARELGGGSGFLRGGYVLLGEPGQLLQESGVKTVLVNDVNLDAVPLLRERYPGIRFVTPGEVPALFGREADIDLGAMAAPELPGAPAGPLRDPQMSTKALENVAGMQDEFAELVADNYDVVAQGRGPVRPVSVYHDANALADELGMTREDFLEIAPRIGDKEVSLGKAFLGGAKQEITDLARQLADGSAADPVAAKNRLDQLSVDVVRMMANIQGRLSEGGRILRSGQEALDPFSLATTPKEKLQLGLLKRYKDNLDDDTIARIAKLSDADQGGPGLVNFLRSMERPKFKDYVGALAYHFLLSGPKTLGKNVLGNVAKRWDSILMRPVESVVEHALSPLQGRVPERFARETLPMITGSYAGAPEGLRKALAVLKKGYDPERLIEDLTGGTGSRKYMEAGRLPLDPFLLSQNRAVRGMGRVTGYGPTIMTAADAMAKSRSFTSATYAWATRKAIQEKAPNIVERAAQILQDAPEEMLDYARQQARKDTFTDDPSALAKLLGAGRRDESALGGGLNYLARFINVPDRVGSWLLDYTPGARALGALFKKGKLREAWGTPDASDIIARQIVGTTVAAAAAGWAFQGKIRGQMPKDDGLRNDAFSTGQQGYSVLLGGHWVPIRDVFGGLAAPVAAAAAYHDAARAGVELDGEELARRLAAAGIGTVRYQLDANYLSTLADTLEAIEAPPQDAGQKVVSVATRAVAGAHIPFSGALRNAAVFMDPRVVERDGALDEIKSGIPGLRQTLPTRIGPRGEELTQNTGRWGGVLPVVPTENKLADPQLAERVERLRYTLQGMRRQYGRTEQALEDAKRGETGEAGLSGKDQEMRLRGAGLRDQLPTVAEPTASIDKTMDEVRALEETIREVRADSRKSPQQRREEEIHWQQRIEKLLTDEIQRGALR